MVLLEDAQRREREQQEMIEREQQARQRNRTAGNWLKGILGLATFNEGVWRGATSGSTDKFLQMSADADPVEIALGVATYVAFSYAGGLGERLGAKNAKGGKLLTYNKVVENAKSKGYTIDPQLKPKVEAEIQRVNNMSDIEQLKGILKIRTDTLESIGKLLSSAKNAGERAELQKSYNETLIKLQEGGLDVQVAELNKVDPAKQFKRDGLSIKEDLEANVEYLNKLDPYKQYSVKNGKIVEDLQKTVESLNKLDPDIQFKVENDAIVRVRKQADPEVIKRNEEITEENLRIAQESIRKMKEAEEKAKAEDKKIDEDPDFDDEKGIPDGVIETKEKLGDDDMPDFSDKADGKESEPLIDKEKPLDEIIDESIERNRQEKEGSDTVKKVSGAGAGAIITTEVVEKLTRGGDDETRRRRNFELDDESGFTEEPVKEDEPDTEPAPAPSPAPSVATANISYINHKEKRTQTTENIDELFSITIKVCTDAYDNTVGEERNYYYFERFSVPFLFFVSQKILYIGFRGTDSVSNILTDLTTADIPAFKNNNNSNFLNRHSPFKEILDPVASNIEFFLGIILELKQSYKFIIDRIEDIDHSINSIVVCGHSLGGAMAQLFTYVYNNSNENKYDKIPIKHTVTYGQPRVLVDKQEYIQLFNDSVRSYYRVWNTLDPIPYVPFKKKVVIDNMMSSNILSGYTHVGNSFDLAGNIVNNDVNLLLYEILQGNKDKIQMLLENKDLLTNSKLLKFMLSDKYLNLQLYTFYRCLENVEVKEEITQEQLTFLTSELQKDTSKLLSYAEKCNLVKAFGIADILKMNPIGDDIDEQNFTIDCIAGCSIASNKITSKAHKLEYYHELLDKLIARQIDEKKPIFEVIDKVNFYKTSPDLFKNVIGMVDGDFTDGQIIQF